MVDYSQLLQATSQNLLGSADGARKLARELEQFSTDTDRNRQSLTSAWSGMDAAAAAGKLIDHSNNYRTIAGLYARIDQIVSGLAGEIDTSKRMLDNAVSMAPSIPGSVDSTGTVHVNWSALGSNPSPAAISAAQSRAQQVAGFIRDALMRANQADQQARAQLSGLMGGEGSGGRQPLPAGQIPAHGTDPQQVKQWWDGLSAEQRESFIATDPKGVGSLDGVPVAARDQANRLALSNEYDDLVARQGPLGERMNELRPHVGDMGDYQARRDLFAVNKELSDVNTRIENLESIQGQLARTDMLGSTESLYLIDYDSAADGQLVMSVGNPDTADNVVTYVPGMTTDVPGIGTNIDRALTMQTDAVAAAPNASTASVMWLGYDAPDGVFGAATDGYYEDATEDLTRFQHGLRATHEGDPSTNTLLGHSYGSTTVGYAASQADLQIDNLVFVASPGSTVDDVGDFPGMDPDHVWATRGDSDIIRFVPEIVHGNDPVDDDFGGHVFEGGTGGHSDYWDPGNPAREGFADIITGQYDQVPPEVPAEEPEFSYQYMGP